MSKAYKGSRGSSIEPIKYLAPRLTSRPEPWRPDFTSSLSREDVGSLPEKDLIRSARAEILSILPVR